MRRCAFLTLADPAGYYIDDELAYEPLAQMGWRVDAVPWNRRDVYWDDYELVVVRSTWDYHDHVDEFLSILAAIDASGARLENPLEIVRWNLEKTYLRDLASRGVSIVPTVWRDRLGPGELVTIGEKLATKNLIVKPQIGANAAGAFRLNEANLAAIRDQVYRYYEDRALMVQPLVKGVMTEGEYSLFYFSGEYSHAILKTPKAGDFRSQEEHGAQIKSAQPDPALLAAGERVLAALDRALLYVRADFVRSGNSSRFWLMELELIEPSLYLRMDPAAPASFALALHRLASRARN